MQKGFPKIVQRFSYRLKRVTRIHQSSLGISRILRWRVAGAPLDRTKTLVAGPRPENNLPSNIFSFGLATIHLKAVRNSNIL
jgi:hypothetical protein